jgi:hypothetical protein
MQNCKNSELYLQKFCYLESAFEVEFENHIQCTGDEYKPKKIKCNACRMAGYSAQVGGGEVEFENPVPLRKGSARVAKWGGNLEMGISRAKPLAEICL